MLTAAMTHPPRVLDADTENDLRISTAEKRSTQNADTTQSASWPWEYALVGGITAFAGTLLVRLYAALQPKKEKISVSVPISVLLWTAVIAFVVVVAMATGKLV
jgi:H+/Cl- antiporter ClcA